MNAIILNDKVYEAVPRGSRHCFDCDLYPECKKDPQQYSMLCFTDLMEPRKIFIFSKELTDKLNK